jgi:hypothetical protein
VPTEARVGVFDDAERAKRTVRWLRRSALHARAEQVGEAYEVVVPSEYEAQALRVLETLERNRTQTGLAGLTRSGSMRRRLFNLELVGTVFAVVVGVVLLGAIGLWLWALAGMIGWLALILVLLAGLAYFHFSGVPHGAVRAPRRYSHKHDVTMEAEQQVQYRLAWAREQYRKSRRWSLRRRRPSK